MSFAFVYYFILQQAAVPVVSAKTLVFNPELKSDQYNLRIEELNRNDISDFGAVISGFTISQDKLATWHETSYGKVRVWDISSSGKVISNKTIKSPHRTFDRPTFGCSMVMDGDFLGVGSYYTWRTSPHDGRFYIFDWKNNRRVKDFNPAPEVLSISVCSPR